MRTPDPTASVARRVRVALCMGLADSYEHGIARGVVRYAKQRTDWGLYGYGWMFRPIESLEQWRGNGIIARVESQADADRLAGLGVPVVDVAGAYVWSGFHQVSNDDEATGRLAGRYLASCGFARFAYCGVDGVAWSAARLAGFRASLGAAAGRLQVFEESLPWWEGPRDLRPLGTWIASLDPPVGLFACNDTAGLRVTEQCRRAGLRVPEEVAVLGVDDEDILCELALPSLSSIALDLDSIGFRAAALLDDLMAGRGGRSASGRRGEAPLVVGPREVVERDSTRVFTCEDRLVEQAVRFIRARACGRLSVGEVARSLPASRRSMEKRFRAALGRTVRDEILRVRLERARERLRGTDDRVADVARACGFATPQRFYDAFRAAEGTTPGAFRKEAPRRPREGRAR